MARTLIPLSLISPEQLDVLRESIEADLMQAARAARPDVKLWKARQLLPWTDLNITSAGQANALTDFWGCGALVASTALVYVNHILSDNEFVAIFGVSIRDTAPCVIKMLFQTGAGASTKGSLNVESMYGSREPTLVTPEYFYYPGGATVFIQLIPDAVGKAAGADGVSDHVLLEGLMCMPAGEVISY